MYQPYPGSDTQLPPAQRRPAPASVRNAVTVMYAAAAASLLGIIVEVLTVNATKTAIEKHSPAMTASQISSTQHALIWLAVMACRRGHGWARITGTVLFGIVTLDTAVGLFVPLAAAVKFWGVLVWLIGLVAVVLLWRRESGAYFRQAPA